MTTEFSISTEWTTALHGAESLRQTSAFLRIDFGERVATRIEDEWSRSTSERVWLAAYPLALWFASSWWRLRWEPYPISGLPTVSWRMAHEMASAGYGFLWPRLLFNSDGENVWAICRATHPGDHQPVRYLSEFRSCVPGKLFERVIDEFVDLVLSRLDAVGARAPELQELWNEVRAERHDPEAFRHRRLEACLGFEPDEAPSEAVNGLLGLLGAAGDAALAEIAPACAGRDPVGALASVTELARQQGTEGTIRVPKALAQPIEELERQHLAPWERGWRLARAARAAWGVPPGCVSDRDLAGIFDMPAGILNRDSEGQWSRRLGLAVRNGSPERLKLLFRKPRHAGRRFEAARFLADHLLAPETDRWLPATDAKTARQKMQRAFAAEFLSPIATLREYFGDDYSQEAIEDASRHFIVSPLTISSHLANNGLISPDDVPSPVTELPL